MEFSPCSGRVSFGICDLLFVPLVGCFFLMHGIVSVLGHVYRVVGITMIPIHMLRISGLLSLTGGSSPDAHF